ncbi:MAG: hypothetical protein ABIJ08_06730 [Nanoarchaeota archaeon]|uniref:Capsid protein n=1 Tax=viral metagenome TaxID=1070528 RepID=A0A6M3KW85_9ZZZZ
MISDAFLQIRTALDSTTEVTGGDSRTGVGAVFINKGIDKMIIESYNKSVDFSPLVKRTSIRQLAAIWNMKVNMGSTSKVQFYSDGAGGTPYPSEFIQLYAQAKSLRSDYEVTGLTIAASSSYFNAIASEAKDAIDAMAQVEEQAFILGDDTSSDSSGITVTGTIGVSGSYKGLYQLMSSAVAMSDGSHGGLNDASTIYGSTRSATVTAKEYKLNVNCVCTDSATQSPLSTVLLNAAITASDKKGGKTHRRIFLCSEDRLNEISALIAPQGRFVVGGSMAQLDGGVSVLAWKNHPIIGSRYMAFAGVTGDGTNATFSDADNAMHFLDMDNIVFTNVAGVDKMHQPIKGADANQRNDVEGGYFKTYGVFLMKRFDTHSLIYNLSTPPGA